MLLEIEEILLETGAKTELWSCGEHRSTVSLMLPECPSVPLAAEEVGLGPWGWSERKSRHVLLGWMLELHKCRFEHGTPGGEGSSSPGNPW